MKSVGFTLPFLLPIAALLLPGHVAQARSPGCSLETPHPAGSFDREIEVDGRRRAYRLVVPGAHSRKAPLPLILDLHGSGVDPETQLRISGLPEVAEREGFLVLAPAAAHDFPQGGKTWNVPRDPAGPDDVAFVEALLASLERSICMDTGRLHAIGFSGGARFASELACMLPHRFASVAAVGGLRLPAGREGRCRDGRSVPIIAFHGLDDPINPYSGNGPPYWTYGVDEAVARWAARNGCRGEPIVEDAPGPSRRISYRGCAEASAVELYRLESGGHSWPGSRFPFPARLGGPPAPLDATTLSLAFFRRHGG